MRFEVWVTMGAAVRVIVEADSEEEARDLAIETADPFDVDGWDFDVDEINPIDN